MNARDIVDGLTELSAKFRDANGRTLEQMEREWVFRSEEQGKIRFGEVGHRHRWLEHRAALLVETAKVVAVLEDASHDAYAAAMRLAVREL